MQLLSLKNAIQGSIALAEKQSSQAERQLVYQHTCQLLTLLLGTPGEASPGWPRAALTLLRSQAERQTDQFAAAGGALSLSGGQRSRPLVELMAPLPSNELYEHLLTILELPEVVTINSAQEMQKVLEEAIAVGAPRYNRGDIAGCARLYLATALSLVNAQFSRGFPGHARALDTLKKGLAEAQLLTTIDDRAWALRHAFDRVLK